MTRTSARPLLSGVILIVLACSLAAASELDGVPHALGGTAQAGYWPTATSAGDKTPSVTRPRFDLGVVPAGFNQPAADAASGTGTAAVPPTAPLPPEHQVQPEPLPPRGEPDAVRLPPRGASRSTSGTRGGLGMLTTTGGALAAVLGLFLVLAWAMRRAAPRGATALPGEVVEVLGRAPLAARQHVHLLRCGNKLLLVSVTPSGAETLTEIADPVEVDRLAGLCRAAQPGSSTAVFRQVLHQFSRETTEPQTEPEPDYAEYPAESYAGRSRHDWEGMDV
ncbi:MAG: flagellar biosynthetic protein FliO [Pirellulales bacterium]|nr:flagellar biosynthetic protein FliO [Pirellulales bacterium]